MRNPFRRSTTSPQDTAAAPETAPVRVPSELATEPATEPEPAAAPEPVPAPGPAAAPELTAEPASGSPGYHLLPSPRPVGDLPGWEGLHRSYTDVVGYSHLGHVFLHDRREGTFGVLHPFRDAFKDYGRFDSLEHFDAMVLSDEGFDEFVLRRPHLDEVARRTGPLGPDQVYVPVPYPFLGGDESPDSYDRGDVWTFLRIVPQMFARQRAQEAEAESAGDAPVRDGRSDSPGAPA
ncbi:T6SS immunity protein Tdi1 domain-containing protein [uncultured Frigoribacterium sp.]|uniref:T6SS immunity protein Tdi1 domain-containing protein n=1 Tax=uncultured Frigoribacterium sp. TaxID=335377 RepID=UPI0028D25935|nr:T6SS immunity protein Tdi1 domain-containing protein [uncultured Frigoribacterium sp.]